VRAVVEDIGVDAVKIGMLGTVATIEAVARSLELLDPATPVVLDPVMVSESGAELLQRQARGALVARLLPKVTVATPNLPEARALIGDDSGRASSGDDGEASSAPGLEPAELARAMRALGPPIVVVTGGHRERPTDVFFDGTRLVEIEGPRYSVGAAHGSGCTHSSVLAARLAWSDTPLQAARVAKRMASEAVRHGLAGLGAGPGPVNVLGVGLERAGTGSPAPIADLLGAGRTP
jgi:hydroxymethylpyrimidine/phosphomethylpyrimidine kinase